MDIKSLINKVIASKGILRVPSWWMKKLLTEIVGYIDSGDSANAKSIDNITTEISHIKNLSLPYMLVSGTGIVNIAGKKVSFTDANKQLIYITGAITFKKRGGSPNNLITYINIPHIDIRSQGRDMSSMFSNCMSLTSLDLSGFDTSAVTNMSSMFQYCRALTSLDLSGFDTSSVTSMSSMFHLCDALTSLDLSGFDTSKVTNMTSMFNSCRALTSLDLSGFDTSSVTSMYAMFYEYRALTPLDLSSFDTSKVTNMEYMFTSFGLTSLDISSFDTSSVTSMDSMFSFCSALTTLLLGPNFFKTSTVTSIDFSDCSKWTNDTVVTSLVTNSYDRASAGLGTLTLQLHANTKAVLSDEQKAAITSKGYTIA